MIARAERPDREGDLVELARHTTAAQLASLVARYRRVVAQHSPRRDDISERRLLTYLFLPPDLDAGAGRDARNDPGGDARAGPGS